MNRTLKMKKLLDNENNFHKCLFCGQLSNGRNRTYEGKDGKLYCDTCHNVLDKRTYRE